MYEHHIRTIGFVIIVIWFGPLAPTSLSKRRKTISAGEGQYDYTILSMDYITQASKCMSFNMGCTDLYCILHYCCFIVYNIYNI